MDPQLAQTLATVLVVTLVIVVLAFATSPIMPWHHRLPR